MIKNYFKIAWRNIKRHKAYSAINIIGLAIGITACLLILQYVTFELSYEDFHQKKDRIYRVQQDRYDNGKLATQWAAGAYAAGNSFKDAVPEIEDYVKLLRRDMFIAKLNNQPFKIEKVFFASASFFNIFSYPLLEGDPKTVLLEPNTAVISQTTARNLFGTENAAGKILNLNQKENFTITGVFKDMPANTQLQANMLLSYATFVKSAKADNFDPETGWLSDGCLTYLLLRKDANPKAVAAKFSPIVEKAVGAELKKFNAAVTYSLQPLTDIHLYSHLMYEPEPNGDGKTVYLLLAIAFFIVVIAWVNYINLATARAISRAKEVGVRKAVGSQHKQLIIQFLSESALLNGFALVLALLLMLAVIPAFNQLSGQHISYSLFTRIDFWLSLTGLFIAGVFLSGLYPAFVLSRFKPVEVLKGKMIATKQGAILRKSLVVFQFTASLFLLIGTLTVYRQIQFMRKQPLGINIEQTLVVTPPVVTDSTFLRQMTAFKEDLLQYPSIRSITAMSTVPGQSVDWNAGGIKLVGEDETKQKQYRVIGVDYDFINAFGLKLIAGRPFSKDFGTDPHAVIFNKTGIELLGFNKPEEAIGKKIDFWGEQFTITGVSENFHQQSLREAYEPLILRLIPDGQGYFAIKTNPQQITATIEKVKAGWDTFFPGNTFDYFFLDEHFNNQYKADQKFGQVFGLFTALAILVACLGLFGLASFTTIQRTKEIGIRKVLGSSVVGILKLLYREFAILLLLAFVVAIPLAWFTTHKWLQGYSFRIGIHWSFFIIPFILIVVIAWLTVSFQSLKAALSNPIKSLKSE
jgi:putative ABC transport system permease protein